MFPNRQSRLQVLQGARTVAPVRLANLERHLDLEPGTETVRLQTLLTGVAAAASGPEGLSRPLARQLYRHHLILSDPPRGAALPACWPIGTAVAASCNGTPLDLDRIEVWGEKRDQLCYTGDRWPGRRLELDIWAGWLMPDDVVDWQPGMAVEAGQWTRSSNPTVLLRYEASTAGQTGVAPPVWPALGETVQDGDVTWTARPATEQPEDVTQVLLLTAIEWYRGGLEIPIGVVRERNSRGQATYQKGDVPPLAPIARTVLRGYR